MSIHAQCLTGQVQISDTACVDENLIFNNTAAGDIQYKWDFCPGSLDNSLSDVSLTDIASANQPFALDYTIQGDSTVVFFVNRGSNTLFRALFANGPTDSPEIISLGNVGTLLNKPSAVQVTSNSGNWYVVVGNDNGEIITINFGSSIFNTSPSAALSFSLGVAGLRGMEFIHSSTGKYLFITAGASTGKVYTLKYSGSLSVAPVLINNSISAGSNPTGISFFNDCGTWIGVVASTSSNQVLQLNYGADLSSIPEVSTLAGVSAPQGITLVKDLNNYFVFATSTADNKVHRFFLKGSFDAIPSLTTVADLKAGAVVAFDIVKYKGDHFPLGIGFSTKDLEIMKFENDCDASVHFSDEGEPAGVSYTTSGWKFIEVTETDVDNTVRVDIDSVYIKKLPMADFSAAEKCTDNPVKFSDISVSSDTEVIGWSWDFGDPGSGGSNTSTLPNPTHIYSLPGEYTVSMTVTDECGKVVNASKTVQVYNTNDLQPDFSFPATVCSNGAINFTDQTSFTDDTPVAWSWDFGGQGGSVEQNPTFIFSEPNDYNVVLTVVGISGCEQSVMKTISVIAGPSPSFTVNDDCVGKALQFNNTSTGDITSTHWDFGNGFTSNLENPLFQYAAPGTYDVTLTLTNSSGCQTSKVLEVNVYELPDVQFTNDLSCEGTPTAFTDETTVGDANVASWKWSFDDPSSGNNTSTDRNPTHTFTTSGAFDVKLVAQTTNGCKDSVQQVVNVKQAPVADFEYDKLCINEAVQFTDTSEPVPGQGITTWSWDLGGVFSAEQNPEATFQFALDYNIGLTVTSENLCTSTTYKTVSVKPAPSISFGVEQACDNAEAHFFDTTDPLGDPITSRSWNFANQATSVDSSAYHAFSQVGNYDVSLTVMTENGCDYSVTESIQINEAPTAVFTPSVTFGAPPLDVEFTNKSVGADSFNWIFEEGSTSDIANPTYTFTEENSYDVKLVASDENGCSDTTTQRINVLYPDLDIVLTALNRNPSDETEVILTVGNNGTVTIDSFQAAIDLGNQAIIEKIVAQTLNPRVSAGAPVQSVNINLGFNINPQNLDYLCVTVTPIFEGLEESDLANNTKCINLSDNQTVILAPYPNPASNQLHLQIISNDRNSATIQLFSTRGDLVKNIEIDALSTGMNNVLINTADIDKGIYMIKASSGGKTAMYKVVVEN